MAVYSIFQFVSLILLSLYFIGFLNNYLSDRENACEMTYMYEYPQFVRIKVPENNYYPQYGLYAYSEGRFTEKARKMRFDGIPVLFIPGNGGSYKQVRSLASVALRKTVPESKYGFHFDYFTIDLNEELSGLFGGVLEKQTMFSTHCLKAIINLYQMNKMNNKPTSIIIVGHSMGGVISRALLTLPQNKNLIDLIITLATPHESPVAAMDLYFKKMYDQIQDYWDLKNMNTTHLTPITKYWNKKVFISIGGGEKDLLVPSALTSSPHTDINVLTTAIPGVWLSTDHLCILWCKQVVLVLNRFLFSIIDPKSKQLSTNTSQILNMGKHYLKIGHSKNYSSFNEPVEFLPEANWYEDSRRQYSFKHDKVAKTWYYMIRLIDLPDNEAVTFQTIDLDDNDWLFGCQAKYIHGQHRICMSGRHLSHFGRWAASKVGKRRIATIDLHAIRASYPHWSHILLRISPTNKPVEIHVDIHNKGSRQIQASLPPMYNYGHRMIIKKTVPNTLQYNISLSGLDMLYQAYLLYVEPLDNCLTAKTHHAYAEITIPWAEGFENYHYFTDAQNAPMRVKLLKGNPNLSKNGSQIVNVAVTLDPQCTYSISISVSLYDALGQFARHYSVSLPAYLTAVLLLVLRHWASNMESKQNVGTSFHSALCGDNVKPYYIILSARLGTTFFLSIPMLQSMTSLLLIGTSSSQNFLLLPLLLYIVALGLAHILGAVCWGFLIFSGQVAHRVLLRLVAFGKSRGGSKFWEWIAKEIRNAPGFASFVLIAIGLGSCGAAALATGAVFYFFMLTKIYEDYLEDFVYKTIAKVAKKLGVNLKKKKTNSKTKTEEESQKNNEKKSSLCSEDSSETNMNTNSNTETEDDGSKVEKQSEQNEETVQNNSDTEVEKDLNNNSESVLASLHFHFAMFFLWCLVTVLNIPTLLTWAHNFKYNKVLEIDPSFYPGLIMSISAFSLWQIDVPKKNIKYYNILNKLIYVAAVMAIMATPMALYRLNYLVSGVFLIITLHQTFPFENQKESGKPKRQDERLLPRENLDTNTDKPENSDKQNDNESIRNECSEEDFEKFSQLKEKINKI